MIHRMVTVRELVLEGKEILRRAGRCDAGRESALILGSLLDCGEAQILARDHEAVAPETASRFRDRLARRAVAEPMAYLVGHREFFGRTFDVDSRVLVPRPETEHLVEIALGLQLPAEASVLDLGTGSGCIAVTLAAERAAWRVVATDLSIGALAVARRNALRHGVAQRLRPVAADLSSGLALAHFDLVVANPPYVEEETVPHLSPDVRDFEPRLALVGGKRGTETLETLIDQFAGLSGGAWIVLEVGFGQADGVAEFAAAGPFDHVATRADLAGIERNVVFRRRA
jgi:release factor glutamine methyltransferase